MMCTLSDNETSTGNNFTGWAPLSWRMTTADDFQEGTTVNTDVSASPGNVILPMTGGGVYTSPVFNTGAAGTIFNSAFWDRVLPSSSTLTLEVRASDALSSEEPNSSWELLGGGTSASLDDLTGQYVQWRATFTSNNPGDIPVLEEVRIYYRLA